MRPKGPPPTHAALAELAMRQHGVVSIRQLTGPLGYSRRSVSRAVAAGRLHRLHRGVFAVGHTRLTQQGRCLAAVLACGPKALLSHDSAAWLWGISTKRPSPYSVTTPVHRSPRPPIDLHHSRTLTADDRALCEGIPVTSLARTFLDVAATSRTQRLQRMLERSEELKLFDLRSVESMLGAIPATTAPAACGVHWSSTARRPSLAPGWSVASSPWYRRLACHGRPPATTSSASS